ncbi:MAG: hypothetical protein IBV53_07240 [Candidatus Atribacteria bacterium]
MKIIITDATYKHSLALAKYIKKFNDSNEVIGYTKNLLKYPTAYTKLVAVL